MTCSFKFISHNSEKIIQNCKKKDANKDAQFQFGSRDENSQLLLFFFLNHWQKSLTTAAAANVLRWLLLCLVGINKIDLINKFPWAKPDSSMTGFIRVQTQIILMQWRIFISIRFSPSLRGSVCVCVWSMRESCECRFPEAFIDIGVCRF